MDNLIEQNVTHTTRLTPDRWLVVQGIRVVLADRRIVGSDHRGGAV